MISRIVPVPGTDTLQISYSDSENVMREEEFDMVVLSVGLCAHPSTAELARKLGVDLNPYGFTKTDPLDVVATSQPGVYVCGAAQGPKDIPDSVQQGSSAAACATSLLSDARGSLIEPPPVYEERDMRGEAAAHRRVRVPLRHKHCRDRGYGRRGAICPDASRGGICVQPDVCLLDRSAKRDPAGDPGVQAKPLRRGVLYAAHA